MVTEAQPELSYGWFSFKPKWLQAMNNCKCFLFIAVMIATIQGMTVNGITGISLPALEKRFQLTSKDLGVISASNDISAILLICFVSFYGQFGNKIKWIGYGAIITAVGFFMFTLPHFIIGPYQPVTTLATTASRAVQECVVKNNTSTTETCFSGYESNRFYLVLFCIAQLLMGAGTTPLYSLAPAYIDENLHPKSSPVYLSLFFAAAMTGPGLGYIAGGAILNNVFVQVTQVSCQYREITFFKNKSLNLESDAGLCLTNAVLILSKRFDLLIFLSAGIVFGGFFVRRFNLKKSCKLSAKYCFVFALLSAWTAFLFMIPGCEKVNLAGVVTPYHNSDLQNPRSPVAPCNLNCSCSLAYINPVCGQDKLTYFSACHAGCAKVTGSKAYNCSCIDSGANKTQGATATKGFCDRGPGCKSYHYFLLVTFVLLFSAFLTAMPNKIVVLRCVPDNQRSYSLGFQFIFQRTLGFMPGPILLGWMFDVNCLFWGESCGRRGRCQIYDIWKLSVIITVFGCVMKALTVLLYFISFWFCKSSYDEEETNPKATTNDQGKTNEDFQLSTES
ncbi:PREDICTED: solute carrier organic anion transporter family member 4A1-like [Acropora digitifera]|uniref:solute carrier organic anion transporter family member 4A1-like n=1 Tax=Acropora digitifera TaxID=70779 RepID=UPI00077B1C52|nr:PREDICTED: solute carrier organic anion transporter family member 4A1-like [Acropora digitifera]